MRRPQGAARRIWTGVVVLDLPVRNAKARALGHDRRILQESGQRRTHLRIHSRVVLQIVLVDVGRRQSCVFEVLLEGAVHDHDTAWKQRQDTADACRGTQGTPSPPPPTGPKAQPTKSTISTGISINLLLIPAGIAKTIGNGGSRIS